MVNNRWANIFQELPSCASPKASFTTTKAPRVPGALREEGTRIRTRSDVLEITCLRFWEPALTAKPNASCGNVRLPLKSDGEGPGREGGKKGQLRLRERHRTNEGAFSLGGFSPLARARSEKLVSQVHRINRFLIILSRAKLLFQKSYCPSLDD